MFFVFLFVNVSGERMSRQGFWKIIKHYQEKAHIEKDTAVEAALDAYTSGNWSSIGGKSEQLGLTQGDYLGLPTADASWGFKTFTKDEYETVLNGIKDGSITVSNDTENQPEVGSHVTVTYVE